MIDEIKAPNVICKYWPAETTETIGNYNPNDEKYNHVITDEYYANFNIEGEKKQKKS